LWPNDIIVTVFLSQVLTQTGANPYAVYMKAFIIGNIVSAEIGIVNGNRQYLNQQRLQTKLRTEPINFLHRDVKSLKMMGWINCTRQNMALFHYWKPYNLLHLSIKLKIVTSDKWINISIISHSAYLYNYDCLIVFPN